MMEYFTRKKQGPSQDHGKDETKDKHESSGAASATGSAATTNAPTVIRDPTPAKRPVLDEEDEAFLQRIVSEEGPPPPLPERPHRVMTVQEAQAIPQAVKQTTHDAERTPLPDAPDTPQGEVANAIEGEAVRMAVEDREKEEQERQQKKKNNRFSWLRRSSSRATKRADQSAAGSSLHDAAQSLKVPAGGEDATVAGSSGTKATEEEAEMASVLEQLNLAAENNRVFSLSEESKDLLKKFNLVLQDLVNGVPTAYHDLESLLTNSDSQIQKTYKSLPPFLQDLIEKLPEKITGKLGPEMLGLGGAAGAAAVESEGREKAKGKKSTGGGGAEYLATGASAAGKLLKNRIPSLKQLLTKQGSVVALLRSIVAALRTRFPALMGMSAVWSVALFVLLFIFWYCHKRGREVRLENERRLTEQEVEEIRRRVAADPAWVPPPGWDPASGAVPTTTAPEGASVDEIQAAARSRRDEQEAEDEEEGEAAYAPQGRLAQAVQKGDVKDDGERGSATK